MIKNNNKMTCCICYNDKLKNKTSCCKKNICGECAEKLSTCAFCRHLLNPEKDKIIKCELIQEYSNFMSSIYEQDDEIIEEYSNFNNSDNDTDNNNINNYEFQFDDRRAIVGLILQLEKLLEQKKIKINYTTNNFVYKNKQTADTDNIILNLILKNNFELVETLFDSPIYHLDFNSENNNYKLSRNESFHYSSLNLNKLYIDSCLYVFDWTHATKYTICKFILMEWMYD
jgi:acetolactate synthase regulatory subunit